MALSVVCVEHAVRKSTVLCLLLAYVQHADGRLEAVSVSECAAHAKC